MRLCVRIRQNERGKYIASCPSLPGCVSVGASEQQARDKLEEAIRGYLASVSNFVPADLQQVIDYQLKA